MQVKDCRMAAPKEKQVGKTCKSNERERTSQYSRNDTKKVESLEQASSLEPRMPRIKTKQGGACASQAGAAFSNPFKSELARDCEITSPSRFANGPAWQMGCRGLVAEGL